MRGNPAPGGDQFDDLLQPVCDLHVIGSTTTAALAAGAVYLYRFRVKRPITVAKALVYLGATVAGNGAVGIYTSDGTTWTRVAASPDAAWAGANATSTLSFAAAITLVPGVDYWVAFGATDATLTVHRAPLFANASQGAIKNNALVKTGAYSAGLPATISSPAGTNIPFWLGLTP